MRIGLVCPYSLTIPGGVQGQVLGLARALRAAGHYARVLAPCDGPPPDASVIPIGVSVPVVANGSIASLAPDPAAQLRTIRALWDESFDVLNLHEPLTPGPTVTALMTTDAPKVGTFHAAGTSASYRYLGVPLRWWAARLALRCAVSRDARSLAAAMLPGHYEVLFNGVEVERYRQASPWPTERPTIMFLGRHEPRKGLAELLEAVSQLPEDLAVWVASDGPQTATLKQRFGSDKRIEWLGRISEGEKVRRLRGADVFCAPSLGGESFGVVLLEAMAASATVVASDLSGYRTVAHSGRDALLVQPGDVDQLAAALRRVLTEGTLAAELSGKGSERARTFSMDRLATRYLELFESITAAPVGSIRQHRLPGRRRRLRERGGAI